MTGGRAEVRLTPALVVLVVLLGTVAGLRPAVASPTVTAVLWAGLSTLVVTGVLWPLLDRRSRRVRVTRCPTDAVEGVPFGLVLTASDRGFPLHVDLEPSAGSLGGAHGPSRRHGPSEPVGKAGGGVDLNAGEAAATAVVERRGVYPNLALRVTDTGPFGLLRVSRVVTAVLPAPLYVGPVTQVADAAPERDDAGNEQPRRSQAAAAGDTVRSVRPYVVGDPAHLVHWPTSAHAGELMVMELEPPGEHLIVVAVDLRGGAPPQVEAAVRLAAGAVQGALDAQARVVLCTAHEDGPLTAEVHSTLQMRRRLAAAVPGVPGAPPEGCHPIVFTPASVSAASPASPVAAAVSEEAPPSRGGTSVATER
jgi:uncharacterized protein (DUF58 family)